MLYKMTDLSFKEMARCSAYGLLVFVVVLSLGYVYPAAQLALLGAAVGGSFGGYLLGRECYKGDGESDG
jgi:hypothetical protein